MKEKKNTTEFSFWVATVIILAGAVITFAMYSLIQKSFFKATVAHEMELMQIMETLGSQLLDSRLGNLKSDLEKTAKQYSKSLSLASDEEIEKTLLAIASEKSERNYCYQTREKQYYSSQLQESDILQIDLSQVWEGDTVLFSPDFNENGAYVMAIAAPVWENDQKDAATGILIEYMDGYGISRWLGEMFASHDLGTAYIIDEEGRNIGTAKEENYDWITTRYNAQELAEAEEDEAVRSIARLEKRAIDGDVGVDTYEWEGQLSYVAYGPLTEAKWGFCVGFYGSQYEAYTREITVVSSRSAGILLAAFLFFLAVILTAIVRNLRKERRYNKILTQQKEEIEQQAIYIAVSEERFRIAMQRSSDIILEYQMETGEISCFYGEKEIKSGCIGDASLRDQLVEGYSMDMDAFGRFKETMQSISRGLTSAECIISGFYGTEKRWYKMSVTAVTGGTLQPTRAVGILRDVTSEHEAELDPLTRLYNKPAITDYMKAAVKNKLQRNAGTFIMLDIDHFKQINDQYGHPVGDRVLCSVAENLQAIFPSPSLCGRFGGDEFCVYCPQSPKRQELEKMLSELTKRVKEIGMVNGVGFVVSISVGAVIVQGHAEFEDIYKKADEILYKAKNAGRDRYCIFEIK